MRGLVKTSHGVGQVELRDDLPAPTADPGWVVADVIACGVCGTDLHIIDDEHKHWPPVVLGHEYVVRITEVGEGVSGFRVGERVVCEQHHGACGECDACRRGAIHLCPSKRSPGWGIDGAFADQVRLPAHLLHRVPDSVPDLAAVVTEPMAICVTGLDRAGSVLGKSVAVIGPGPVGLLTALIARAGGASLVTVLGRQSSQSRLDLARSLGLAVVTLEQDGSLPDRPGEQVTEFDVVVETSGAGNALSLAMTMTRRLGAVVCLGIGGRGPQPVDYDQAMTRSLTVAFSMSSEYSAWDRALRLLAAGLDPTPLVTTYSLDKWREMFEAVRAKDVVKAVVLPGKPA